MPPDRAGGRPQRLADLSLDPAGDGPPASPGPAGKRTLVCSACGALHPLEEACYRLRCEACGEGSLLVARAEAPPRLPARVRSLADWGDWLSFSPFCPEHRGEAGLLPAQELGRELGLPNLLLLVSGHAPEHGATLVCGSFKEFEAIGTLSRIRALGGPVAVIASAANSALAALELGSRHQLPAVLVVPDRVSLAVTGPEGPVGPLAIRLREATYADVKEFAASLVARGSGILLADGGYRNVARRDALALPYLSAVRRLGRMPAVYVQAVSSGCGALAVLEASCSLIAGGLGPVAPRLLLVQNHPYAPIVEAHSAGLDHLPPLDRQERGRRIRAIAARVLSSTDIPYAQPGGIRDALRRTHGLAVAVTNREIEAARRQLARCLNLEVCEASGAALAGLVRAVGEGSLDPQAEILLHLTGAGRARLQAEGRLRPYGRVLELGLDQLPEALQVVLPYAEAALARGGGGRP